MSKAKFLALAIVIVVFALLLYNWPNPKESDHSIETGESLALPVEPVVVYAPSGPPILSSSSDAELPEEVDRMNELFKSRSSSLPFIESLAYAARVDWLSGRPAYLGDYSAHYQTSKHFISRSIRGAGNYLSDVVSKGQKFNVYRKDYPIEFHLIVDLSRLKLWLYCHDKVLAATTLLKTYRICAGKLDGSRPSGSLTPTGHYAIGKELAVYQPGDRGSFKNDACEMITIYGKRWIPFGKGLGLHGVPWKRTGEALQEQSACIGHYETEGSIRLLTEDIEEIYAVIASKPASLQIVKDFSEAQLPSN